MQRLQGLILIPIYTSPLYLSEPSQYSNYGLIYTFIAFMNFFYLYGMDSAFLRYFFLGKSDRKTIFSTVFFILFGTSLLSSVLLWIFSDILAKTLLFSSELSYLVRLAALILFLDTLGNFPFLILRAQERPVAFTVFRMLRFSLEILFNLLFVVILKKGVPGILYANVLASFLNLLIMFPFAAKLLKPVVDFSLLKEMLKFGLPFLPNGIALMTIEMIDRFLVTKYLGKDILAFYHANYKFATVLLLLIIGFRNAWQPFFLKIAKEPDARITYSRILNYYVMLSGIVVIAITLFIKDILTQHYFQAFYILGKNYWAGIPFIPWIVLSYFLFGIYVIFTPAFYISKKSQFMILFTGSGAVVNIVVNLLLLPRIGIWGAVVATVLAYLVMTLTIYLVAQRIHPIPIPVKNVLITFLGIGCSYFIYYIWNPDFWVKVVILILMIAGFIKYSEITKQIRFLKTNFNQKQDDS
ncbi:MAG: oligosaccharide flippase family protein [Calditrichia bacterium]